MRHNIEVVIDRLTASPEGRARLAEAVELALKLGGGNLVIAVDPPDGAAAAPTPELDEEADDEAAAAPAATARAARRKRTADDGASPASDDIYLSAALCLHALRPQLRAPQPAAIQLQQPARDVYVVRWVGRGLHVRSRSLDSGSRPVVQARGGRIDRPVARPGALAASHFRRRGRHARTSARAGRGANSRYPVGRTRPNDRQAIAVGHRRPARHLHLAAWAGQSQVRRKIHRHHPRAVVEIPHQPQRHAAPAIGKIHARGGLRGLRRRAP